jgi:hypothetical protein
MLRPKLLGFSKNALRSARQFVDEHLRDLAEAPAREDSDWQAGNPLSGSTCNPESRCNSGVWTASQAPSPLRT